MKTKRTPNAEVGKVGCAFCGRQASARRNSAGKLYYLCNGEPGAPGCGMITPNLPGGQAWMAANLRAEPAPAPVTATPPAAPKTDHQAPPAPVNVNEQPAPPAPVDEPAQAPGFFSQILNTRIV